MIKHYCDLCKRELKQGERRQKYRIKQFKKTDYDFRWIEIEAHDKCIDRILEVVFCEEDDNPFKKVKTAFPLESCNGVTVEPLIRPLGGKEND